MSLQTISGVIPTLTIGQRLRVAREYAGLEQSDIAAEFGISRGSISAFERGITPPRRVFLRAWAEITGVDSHWLETGEPGPDGSGPGSDEVAGPGFEPGTSGLQEARLAEVAHAA
jgi:transcriptional regulator with XRE-family HTH domain